MGGGNKPGCETSALAPSCGAQFCLFKAKDNTLSNFTDAGSMYTTNETFGLVDSNIVWQPTNTSANMMECPDFFPLGSSGKHVLIGSLYKTNQWWIGTVAGNPPRFTPESVGIVDYGNGYAAKTGSTWKQTGASRRLVFVSPATACRPRLSTRLTDVDRCCQQGFTGWQEPTAPTGCGRYLIMPRDLSISTLPNGPTLSVNPVPEAAVLRVPGSRTTAMVSATSAPQAQASLASGSQVEIQVNCTAASWPSTGKVAVRTLASADGKNYVEIGFDFSHEALPFYADHSHCCAKPNTIVQVRTLSLLCS